MEAFDVILAVVTADRWRLGVLHALGETEPQRIAATCPSIDTDPRGHLGKISHKRGALPGQRRDKQRRDEARAVQGEYGSDVLRL